MPRRSSLRRQGMAWGKHAILMLFAFISLYPIILMWLTALRPTKEVMKHPLGLPNELFLGNLTTAWTKGHFSTYMVNSVILMVPTVVGVVVLSCLAGYGISRFRFPGRNLMFYALLLGLTIPFQSVMIPLFHQLMAMGLLGNYLAVILPSIAFGLPFGVFLMQAFFEDLPHELADAARVDGCSEFRIFRSVMLPLAWPAVATLVVFQMMRSWNEFLMPLLYLQSEDMRPVPLGLLFFQGVYTRDVGLISAGVTIASVPVILVYILFQRQFVKGLTAGAVK
jgi:raffinose/stachyose/melibiose transport system permease protein